MSEEEKPFSIQAGEPLYRQEAPVGMYQIMFPYYTMAEPMKRWLPVNYGEIWMYYRQGYFTVGYYTKSLEKVASAILEACKDGFPEAWENEWQRVTRELEISARKLWKADMIAFSLDELLALYDELYKHDIDMWAVSICIDALDIGADRDAMDKEASPYGFTEDEIGTLSTPEEPSFITGWELALEKVAGGTMTMEEIEHNFFWYGVSYSDIVEVDETFIIDALTKRHSASFVSPTEAEKRIFTKHRLSKNPLATFRRLIAWRDERKYLNYLGLYGLVKVKRELLRRHAYDPAHANAILPTQLPDVLSGALSHEQLASQFNDGTFVRLTKEGEFKYFFGKEAAQCWAVLDEAFMKAHAHDGAEELKGTVASKGKTQGRVQVVMNFNDPKAAEFKKGDILVTSMTRPEFLPLMKLSAAIVTNEGGITSHAAIVSRELRIPCIIGTKIATQVLKDGDIVEVDAVKGIVRKL